MLVVRKRKGFHQLDDFRAIDADESGKLSDQSGNWCSSDWPTDLVKHLSRPSFSMSPTNPPNHQKTHFSRRVRSMLLSKMWLPTIPTPLSSASQGPVSPRSPPPDVGNGSNFSKGSNFEIIKWEVSGQCMFVCIQYLEVADYGKVPKGISYSSPNPRSRGASGEIMAVNKTLGIIYHLLAEKCRRESIIYIITYIILGLNSAIMISSIK